MWPGTSYDPTIPTQESVLGFAPGKRISSIEHMQRYMRTLADAAPERVVLREYARSWEGRSLIYLVIGSADNIAQLDAYDAGIQALGDPRVTNQAAAESLIATLPSSVWLSYGVHGNEISSMDAAMVTAYHLLAAKNDPVVDKILDNTLVFLDPAQNPDRPMHDMSKTTTRQWALKIPTTVSAPNITNPADRAREPLSV